MVATGTGTAPFRSMLLAEGALPAEQRTGRRRVLIEGCRVAEDLGYFDGCPRLPPPIRPSSTCPPSPASRKAPHGPAFAAA